MIKITAIMIMLLVFSGCATLSQEECLRADWHAIGKRDGNHGYPVERLGSHQKACDKYGITLAPKPYFEGHALGVLSYCTPENGYQEAIDLREYRYVCPVETELQFLLAYTEGLGERLFALDYEYREARRGYERVLARLYRVKDEERRQKLESRAFYYKSELDRLDSLRHRINGWLRLGLRRL